MEPRIRAVVQTDGDEKMKGVIICVAMQLAELMDESLIVGLQQSHPLIGGCS